LDIHERLLEGAGRLSRAQVKAGERKLLSILPLHYKNRREFVFARELFKISSEADPKNAHTWQAWALMEKEAGNVRDANRLIESGLASCPHSPELDLLKKKILLLQNNEPKLERVKYLIEQKDTSAETELKELLFCNPQDPDVLCLYHLWQQQQMEKF